MFVDTSAYLALADRRDARHAEAIRIVGRLADQHYRQYTTNVLLIEAHALLLSTLGRVRATQFLRDMDDSNTVVVRVRALDEVRAKQILFQYGDKDFSFADAISFTVMERLHIPTAFAFDRHFAQYGIVLQKE